MQQQRLERHRLQLPGRQVRHALRGPRAAGSAGPVLGAHTLGFNAHSSAIAVIGDYAASASRRRVAPSIAAGRGVQAGRLRQLRRPAGPRWSPAAATATRRAAGSLNRISGHRDAGRPSAPATRSTRQLARDPRDRRRGPGRPAAARDDRRRRSPATCYYTQGPVQPLWTVTTASRADQPLRRVRRRRPRRVGAQQPPAGPLRLTPGRAHRHGTGRPPLRPDRQLTRPGDRRRRPRRRSPPGPAVALRPRLAERLGAGPARLGRRATSAGCAR